MTKAARIVEFLVSGDRAAVLYGCELPQPVGTLRIASFFKVERGKIRTYDTRFDATELRKLLARPSAPLHHREAAGAGPVVLVGDAEDELFRAVSPEGLVQEIGQRRRI